MSYQVIRGEGENLKCCGMEYPKLSKKGEFVTIANIGQKTKDLKAVGEIVR